MLESSEPANEIALPVQPVVAASVILLRQSIDGLEVFMVRRHIKSDFAADVYVFPGGKAGSDDSVMPSQVRLSPIPTARSDIEPELGWSPVYVAAIRELFEEAGILLAERTDGTPLNFEADASASERFGYMRDEVRSGNLSLEDLAKKEELVYRADRLHLFSNWLTPEILSKRFNTYFFLAEVPKGQDPRHADLHELTDSLWISASAALERFRSGAFPLVFATERHLQMLASFETPQELLGQTEDTKILRVMPRPITVDGRQDFLIPGDPGYEEAVSR